MATSYGTSNRGKASYSSSGARLCCVCHKNKVTPPAKKCQSCKNKTKRSGNARRAANRAGGYSRCSSPLVSSSSPIAVNVDFYREKTQRAHDYRYPIVVRDLDRGLIQVGNLPTNEDELGLFVAMWLSQPGHTLSDVEQITPAKITVWPDQYSLSALRLIEKDIPPASGYRMAFGPSTMFAQAVPA
jgi:hypothetical protein